MTQKPSPAEEIVLPRKLVTKNFDTQAIAVQSLSREFLDVSDHGIEIRAYLVDTTIPSVVMALDNLLREVERRGLLKDDKAPSDRPKFDAINWLGRRLKINCLGQYLYRNNPRFANAHFQNETQAAYQSGLSKIASKLKTRHFDLETTRRAKARAEELSRKQKEQEQIILKIAHEHEIQKIFAEVLHHVYDEWAKNLLRPRKALFLLRKEVVRTHMALNVV